MPRPYLRPNGRLQLREGGGQFRQHDLDRDFGVRLCPWCRRLTAIQPDLSGQAFVDPCDVRARVCPCGYDSRRGKVGHADLRAAVNRLSLASRELQTAEPVEPDVLDILLHQYMRESHRCNELAWLGGPV